VYNDCASKCVKSCAQLNPPCVKMCAPRCACPPEIPVWQNGQCIQQKQCPVTQKEKIMTLKALKQQDKKIPSLWESLTSLFVATNVECTTGPGGKRCENGGVEHGTLGTCKCECPRLTAGDNCEIVIAIGRPYSHLQSTIQTTLKTCANHQDMTCTGGWNMEDAMPVNVFDGSEIFDHYALQQAIDAYTLQGIAEHTSIASFSRVTLQLLSIGAPASIVGLSLSLPINFPNALLPRKRRPPTQSTPMYSPFQMPVFTCPTLCMPWQQKLWKRVFLVKVSRP
jgi:hypothetical protein